MLFDEMDFYRDVEKMDRAIYKTKELFGESEPFVIEKRLDGSVVIFSVHFITTAREAMSTGCMAKMDEIETLLFEKFIRYQNNRSHRDITKAEGDILVALDEWFQDDVNCIPHPVINACYDAVTHTWDSCTN